jgi:hypothetical protein
MGLYNFMTEGDIEVICNKCVDKKVRIKHGKKDDDGKFNLSDHTLGHGCWET